MQDSLIRGALAPLLLITVVLLVLMHRWVRRGTRPGAWSVGEAFVFSHWVFLVLPMVLVLTTGGQSWGLISLTGSSTNHMLPLSSYVAATWTALLGLIGFAIGGRLAIRSQTSPREVRRVVQRRQNGWRTPETPAGLLLVTSAILVFLSAYASFRNVATGVEIAFDERSNVLLSLSLLVVPGAILAWWVALDRHQKAAIRIAACSLALLGSYAASLEWTRRSMLTIAIAGVLITLLRRRGGVNRRALFLLLPAGAVAAAGLMVYRMSIYYNRAFTRMFQDSSLLEFTSWYTGRLWLETSSYAGAAYVAHNFGLWTLRDMSSLVAPFMFWIPRSVWAGKPSGFDLAEILQTAYSVPVLLYAEAFMSLSVGGMFLMLVTLGYGIRRLDLRGTWGKLRDYELVIYIIISVDVLWLLRGAWATMMRPVFIHSLVVLVLIWGLRQLFFWNRSAQWLRRGHRLPSQQAG